MPAADVIKVAQLYDSGTDIVDALTEAANSLKMRKPQNYIKPHPQGGSYTQMCECGGPEGVSFERH